MLRLTLNKNILTSKLSVVLENDGHIHECCVSRKKQDDMTEFSVVNPENISVTALFS